MAVQPNKPGTAALGPWAEVGQTGLHQYGGYVNEEWLPALYGRNAVRAYTEMKDNDAIVGAVLYVVEMMMRQATWRVDPASKDSLDEDAAQHIEECMDDMDQSWTDSISEILSFLPFGWSLHEIVYKKRLGEDTEDERYSSKFDDGMIGWRGFPIRSQDSLLYWDYDPNDRDRLLGMTQIVMGEMHSIPIEKALLFRTKAVKNNPEGRSILRNAYRSWYLKKKIEDIEAIGIDRDLAGLPMLDPPEDIGNLFDPNDPEMVATLDHALSLLKNIRMDQQQGVLVPPGWTLSMLGGNGRKTIDAGAVIQRYDTRIAMTALADFVLLGHSENGTYEMHRNKVSQFASAIGSYLDMIAGVFNTKAVPKLLKLNPKFANLEEVPEIAHSAVETPDMADFARVLQYAVAGGILKPDPGLEDHVRSMLELPERPDDEVEEAPQATEQPPESATEEPAEFEPPSGKDDVVTPTAPTPPAAASPAANAPL